MPKQKHYEYGSGMTNEETTDQAAEQGSDHNEAQAQKPEGTVPTEAILSGQTTTTTPDSERGESAPSTQSVGELDQRSPEDITQQLRGWAKRNQATGGAVRQADWEEFHNILKSGQAGPVRRP